MQHKINKLKKVSDGGQNDLQQLISALQKENIKLQKENAKLIFDKRKLILDLKQRKLDFTELQITYKEDKMKCTEKMRALEDEIINIKKTRPTVAELMSRGGAQLRKAYPKEAFYGDDDKD